MEQYISKATVAAELERRLEDLYELLPDASKVENGTITISEACNTGKYTALESFKDYVDTLEVKEVDLNREIEKEIETRWHGEYLFTEKFKESAKHFFELGMAVANKT